MRTGAIVHRRMLNLILIRLKAMERHGPHNSAEAEAFLLAPTPHAPVTLRPRCSASARGAQTPATLSRKAPTLRLGSLWR